MAEKLRTTKTNRYETSSYNQPLVSETFACSKTENDRYKHELMAALQREDFKIELLNGATMSR